MGHIRIVGITTIVLVANIVHIAAHSWGNPANRSTTKAIIGRASPRRLLPAIVISPLSDDSAHRGRSSFGRAAAPKSPLPAPPPPPPPPSPVAGVIDAVAEAAAVAAGRPGEATVALPPEGRVGDKFEPQPAAPLPGPCWAPRPCPLPLLLPGLPLSGLLRLLQDLDRSGVSSFPFSGGRRFFGGISESAVLGVVNDFQR